MRRPTTRIGCRRGRSRHGGHRLELPLARQGAGLAARSARLLWLLAVVGASLLLRRRLPMGLMGGALRLVSALVALALALAFQRALLRRRELQLPALAAAFGGSVVKV